LKVIYLVYNEAYLSNRVDGPIRCDLAAEAIRLGRMLVELMPDEPEAGGLLALMLVQHGRAGARFDEAGDLVTLEQQHRGAWNRETIAEGSRLLESAMRRGSVGPYQLHAAVAALHSEALSWDDTDWRQIAALYDVLARLDPGPVVALNRAVAVGFAQGPDQGLAELDRLTSANLPQPHLLHAARAEMLLRAGDRRGAAESFDRALDVVRSGAERRHLERRRASVGV
jgi:RNA polymerase sigma-70 factor (ECF subfamily)